MVARLEERTGGIPVTAAAASAVAGLRQMGVERVTLVHPPWFDEELNSLWERLLSQPRPRSRLCGLG